MFKACIHRFNVYLAEFPTTRLENIVILKVAPLFLYLTKSDNRLRHNPCTTPHNGEILSIP